MGQIRGRIKGIKFRYAADNIYSYHENDILCLKPEPDNPYDENAIAIYDMHNHHIGYIGREINAEVLSIIRNHSYNCFISKVYYGYDTPSIEYTINYFDKKSNDDFNPYDIFGDADEDIKTSKVAKNKKNDLIELSYELTAEGKYLDVVNLLKNYCETDNAEILYLLGSAYLGLNKESIAINYLKKSDYLGNINAKCMLGNYYYSKEEYARAYKFLKPAADNDFIWAYVNLGQSYLNGLGVDQNPRLAFLYFKKAADAGISEGYFNLAICYDEGKGTPQNLDKAIEYYEKAANLDNKDAIFNLGVLYYESQGKYHDVDKAISYFNEYLNYCDDDFGAYNYLGLIYYEKGDFDNSIKNLKIAVSLGDSKSAFNLGVIYTQPNNRNVFESKKWFKKAAEMGNEEAYKYL